MAWPVWWGVACLFSSLGLTLITLSHLCICGGDDVFYSHVTWAFLVSGYVESMRSRTVACVWCRSTRRMEAWENDGIYIPTWLGRLWSMVVSKDGKIPHYGRLVRGPHLRKVMLMLLQGIPMAYLQAFGITLRRSLRKTANPRCRRLRFGIFFRTKLSGPGLGSPGHPNRSR